MLAATESNIDWEQDFTTAEMIDDDGGALWLPGVSEWISSNL
jgi:hypothetical protein